MSPGLLCRIYARLQRICTNFAYAPRHGAPAVLVSLALALALCDTVAAETLRVGSVTLRSCENAFCGSISRALDPARPTGRWIQGWPLASVKIGDAVLSTPAP